MKIVPQTPWLFPEELAEVVGRLLGWGLIKCDNNRNLPLKSGGKTDVYINLRDARNHPKALKYISELFAIPLRRLNLSRFVEIPDAVSCFAGQLSDLVNLPYLTIREQAKAGRATDAKMIGNPSWGESVCTIDDVITDGASKFAPHQECLRRGLRNEALVVLVDRQQGWRKKFAGAGIDLPVWAGMTLHDVRRELIKMGAMQRCSPEVEAKNPVILALDGKDWEEILPIMDQLRTTGTILKVNDLMFAQGFDNLLPELDVYGRIMVDLKGHDIKNTLINIMKRLRYHAPWAVTVHASGGEEMVREVVSTLAGTDTKVLAVTVLTSIDPVTCKEIYHCRPMSEVLKLAAIAKRAGAHGLVCSVEEVRKLRSLYPEFTLVTPGVRSPGADVGDQKRVDTPRAAMDNGATNVVMGRQLMDAVDPVAEFHRVTRDELGINLAA